MDSDSKDEKEEPIFFNDLLNMIINFIKIKGGLSNKNFLINSVCNLIGQMIRTLWIDFKNPDFFIQKILEEFIKVY